MLECAAPGSSIPAYMCGVGILTAVVCVYGMSLGGSTVI